MAFVALSDAFVDKCKSILKFDEIIAGVIGWGMGKVGRGYGVN